MRHPWELSPFSQFTEDGDPDYKKELATCPEFTLVEHFREGGPTSVELSPEVERAYHRARMNTNDSEGEQGRIDLANSLEALAALGRLYAVAVAGAERDEAIKSLSGTLLLSLVEHLGVPIAEALAQGGVEERKEAFVDVAAKFKKGLENLHRKEAPILGKAPGGRALLPLKQMLIPIAVAQFRKQGGRPTKGRIRSFLENMGYQLKKRETWDIAFEKVGLGRLPWD